MSGGWEQWAARLARSVERRVDHASEQLRGQRRARQVVPYRGFGNEREVHVSGRVLANRPVDAATDADGWWRNLSSTLRHLESYEVPGARVRLRCAGDERVAVTDDEGYFRAWLTPRSGLGSDSFTHTVHVDVLEPLHAGVSEVRAEGTVIVPRTSAEYAVISDMDDTVIRTDATRLLPMLRRTLLENARTRLPFAGVAEFYRALHDGAAGDAQNPIFYVSSSPWNLYSLLTDFLEHHGIPHGPLLLRDWGISERGVLPAGHAEHKLGAIRQIFECYPDLPFILIGDSGQQDPEIYRDVVHAYGERVRAVYIRNVTPKAARAAAVQELGEEVRAAGSVLLLSDDSAASARHAATAGWIRADAAAAVERAVSSS